MGARHVQRHECKFINLILMILFIFEYTRVCAIIIVACLLHTIIILLTVHGRHARVRVHGVCAEFLLS